MASLAKITPATMMERIERYSGVRPLTGTDPVRIRSRHLANLDGDNQRVVAALADELEKIGQGRLKVRLVQFSHRGISLHNVEAELAGAGPELVLVTAHLDSTAADNSDFDEAHGAAPGADDDASGVAAVLAAAGSSSPCRRLRRCLAASGSSCSMPRRKALSAAASMPDSRRLRVRGSSQCCRWT